MDIEKIDNFDKFLSIRDEWNSLLERSGQSSVSMTHEWLSCWWEAFGGDAELWVLLLRENGRLVGAGPLMLRKDRLRGFSVQVLTLWVNRVSPEGNILLAQKKAHDCLIDFLDAEKRKWDVLRLQKVPVTSGIAGHLRNSLSKNGFRCIIMENRFSPFIDTDGEWYLYYSERTKKFQKVMRNKINRLNKSGTVEIQCIAEAGHIRSHLEEIFSVSHHSWKARVGRSITDDPCTERLYRRVTDVLGVKNMVNLWVLRFNESVIAFEYHVTHRNVTHPIRADFDERYRHLSPGSVLEQHILRQCFEDPKIKGYNSCANMYQYLNNWATRILEYSNLDLFNSSFYSRNLFLMEDKIIPLARRIKRLGSLQGSLRRD